MDATRRERRPLKGKKEIAVGADRARRAHKVGKHFDIEVEEGSFRYSRNQQRIADEAALDGFYVIRANVSEADLTDDEAVRSYKSLSRVERAFRSFKSVDLKVRPVHHRLAGRVKAHVLLCMLASNGTCDGCSRRSSSTRTRLARATRPTLTRSPSQGRPQANSRRTARTELPDPARRSRHTHQEPSQNPKRRPSHCRRPR